MDAPASRELSVFQTGTEPNTRGTGWSERQQSGAGLDGHAELFRGSVYPRLSFCSRGNRRYVSDQRGWMMPHSAPRLLQAFLTKRPLFFSALLVLGGRLLSLHTRRHACPLKGKHRGDNGMPRLYVVPGKELQKPVIISLQKNSVSFRKLCLAGHMASFFWKC